MKKSKKILTFVILLINCVCGQISNFDSLITNCCNNWAQVEDYSCLLDKKELVDGEIKEEKNIIFKFKKPFSVYMKWTEGSNEDIESIYVEGKYDNELQIHLNGLFSFINIGLDPLGHWAMRNNRHSILEAGIGKTIEVIVENYNRAKLKNEGKFEFVDKTVLYEREVLMFNAKFPKDKNYYGRKVNVYFDTKNFLPIKIEVYGWNNEFLEEYIYKQLKLNIGLSEIDFDVNNPEYGY